MHPLICAATAALLLSAEASRFLSGQLAPGPGLETLMVRSYRDEPRTASYDGALAALWLLQLGRRDEAGRLLAGLAAYVRPDGGVPFSFAPPGPPPGQVYVRSGAVAWAGYAAARYLASGGDGPGREAIARLALGAGRYLASHTVPSGADPRAGLVTGGEGRYAYALVDGALQESFVPGEVPWAAAEHNIDAYFCYRALARWTGDRRWHAASERVATALVARLWDDARGQFYQGVAEGAPDATPALDCASWGAIFLTARGDRARAARALAATEAFAASDARSGARGHKPYARRALIEYRVAFEHYRAQLPADDWARCEAVWPEGSAGVALAALRAGQPDRAARILDGLEPLRDASGGLACLSLAIPLEFDDKPAIAGTAWAALVRAELDGRSGAGAIWSE